MASAVDLCRTGRGRQALKRTPEGDWVKLFSIGIEGIRFSIITFVFTDLLCVVSIVALRFSRNVFPHNILACNRQQRILRFIARLSLNKVNSGRELLSECRFFITFAVYIVKYTYKPICL